MGRAEGVAGAVCYTAPREESRVGSLPSLMPRLRQGPGGAGRIDRLGWKAGTCFDAYGLRVGVRTNAPVLLEQLEPHLPGMIPVIQADANDLRRLAGGKQLHFGE